MRVARALVLTAFAGLSAGCYHQVVNTGRAPSPTTVNKPWTATWLWGLVPASSINVTQQCPAGIATVSTQQSVPNGIATILTLGLYTPRAVTVQCAAGANGGDHSAELQATSRDDLQKTLNDAVELSERTGKPVQVRF